MIIGIDKKKLSVYFLIILKKELELYANDHLFVDPLDDKEANIEGPVSQYRKFSVGVFWSNSINWLIFRFFFNL